jgi:PAS domain S-box-containing protein
VWENARVVRNKLGDILYFEGTLTDVNEVKLAQEALQMSEERFRVFVEQSAEAIWCFESPEPMPINLSEERQIKYLMETDCLTECNNTMARMYGFEDARQILGIKLKNFLDPTNTANIEYLRLFIRSKYRLINAESYDVYKDGRPKYLMNTMIGVVNEGRLVRVWGTQRDITNEKQAAQRLSSNEEKFRTLTETVASAIFIFTEDNFFYVNPVMERLSGYSKEELFSLRFVDIIHPDFREMIQGSAHIRLNRSRLVNHHEVKIITKSGEERWVDIAIGMTNYDGKPARLATAMDITDKIIDRKRIEDILQQSKERNQAFIDENPICQFIADADGIVTDCNPAFTQLLGYKSHRDVIRALVNILGPSKRKQNDMLKQLRKTATVYDHAIKLANASGHAVAVVGYLGAVQDSTGAFICIKGSLVPKGSKRRKVVKH